MCNGRVDERMKKDLAKQNKRTAVVVKKKGEKEMGNGWKGRRECSKVKRRSDWGEGEGGVGGREGG